VPRTVLCCIVLTAFVLPVRAEPTVTSSELLIRLTVQPMPAPKPALRYLLLPELKEMIPGNPIANYLRCLLDQDFTADRETIRRSALRQADRAARMDKPDWQILHKLKTDGLGLLLPDVQKMRQLASALQERFHEEVAQRRFDDALRTAKTMFALSRHMGEHPTLIGDLVGIAIATITIGPLEEMLEQPGCPNLFWALTNLPDPLISVNKGMEGERVLIRSEFPELNDREPMTKCANSTANRRRKCASGSRNGPRTWRTFALRVASSSSMASPKNDFNGSPPRRWSSWKRSGNTKCAAMKR
jgi:hypothetical protein